MMRRFARPCLFGCFLAACLLSATPAGAASVVVEFPGAHAFPVPKLVTAIHEQLDEIHEQGLSMARADDAAYFLGAFYRKQGYARVDVKYEVHGDNLTLRVNEGPHATVRSLKFNGNHHYTDDVLAQYFNGVTIDKLAEEKIPYVEAEISAGGDRVRGFYHSEGYLDALVDVSGTHLSADGTAADVVVKIVEGTHYTFGEISFTGAAPYTRAQLLEALAARPGGPFTPSLADAMQGSLRSWLRQRGHFHAEVTVEADKEKAINGRVPVTFVVTPGPKFRVAKVELRGLDRVTPGFMENRFSKITGAVYDPAAIDEKYRELLRTGLFRTLHVVPKQTGADRLELDIEAEEAKQKNIGLEVGYGSYDGLIAAVHLGDKNIFRSGRPLTLTLETSERGFEGEFLYVDPWLFETDWTLRARLYSQARDEQGYSKKAVGLRLDASRQVAKHVEFSAFTEFAVTDITAKEIDPIFLGPTNYTLAAIGIAQKVDFRDNPLNPRHGFVFTDALELDALDGELAFARVTLRYSQYRAFGRSLLGLGLRTGWIIPVGDDADVPIDLRYFNGGGTTVRSFGDRDLGPRDHGGKPLGGLFYTVANLEWDFPITSVLGGAVFVDAGNLVQDSSPSFDGMSYALGVGLRYELPIGPMRLDYGFNPSPRAGEDSGAVHFSFGFAF